MTDPDWSECPEATHFDPVDQNFLREVGEALLLFNNKRGWVVPTYTAYGLSIEECQRPLLRRPPWNGEGLAPVGSDVECTFAIEEHKVWHRGTVVFQGVQPEGGDFIVIQTEQASVCYRQDGRMVRPYRAPEQIAADERLHSIRNALTAINESVEAYNESLACSAAIRVTVEAMIDAGYRKQVAP